MNRILTLLLLACFFINSKNASAQSVSSIKADDLLSRLKGGGGDTTFVVNFWATWCAPCVRELPQFETLNSDTSFSKLKVLLVSLDFKRDYETRLMTFLQKKGMKSEVLFMNESDANSWVPKINKEWSGVIPATWIVNQSLGISEFKSSELEDGELREWVKTFTQ